MNSTSRNTDAKSKPTANADNTKPASDCTRCGTCCKKGGPSFHHQDKVLIEKGLIHSRYLYTIRKGEMAYDNVRRCLEPVSSDIIKIKSKNDRRACIFLDEAQNACTIYENRPIECRALKCWDTAQLEDLYAKKRLKRRDLIAEIEGLWDLIQDHQERCNYETVQNLVRALKGNTGDSARQKLTEIIQFDIEIRKLVVSQGDLDERMLDFLFGRPLTQTLKNYGLTVMPKGKQVVLVQRK